MRAYLYMIPFPAVRVFCCRGQEIAQIHILGKFHLEIQTSQKKPPTNPKINLIVNRIIYSCLINKYPEGCKKVGFFGHAIRTVKTISHGHRTHNE